MIATGPCRRFPAQSDPVSLRWLFPLVLVLLVPGLLGAQGTAEDYRRALALEETYRDLVTNVAEDFRWIEGSPRLTFRRSVAGGHEFLLADGESGEVRHAFDHDRMAAGLSAATGETYEGEALPFRSFEYAEDETAVEMQVRGTTYRCTLEDYRCSPAPRPSGSSPGGAGGPGGGGGQGSAAGRASPDAAMEASIENYNVVIRAAGSDSVIFRSHDGSEGNAYAGQSLSWSPDSRRLIAWRVVPGYERRIHYIETAPTDQLQPRHSTRVYTKPGDVLDMRSPVLIDIEEGRQIEVDNALFPNAYSLSAARWRADGREFVFEYNQRGHEVYRVIAVDARTGRTRAIISEEPGSFFFYRNAPDGRRFLRDLDDGREILWMSERDGWNHLYLYDGETGSVKNQITRGEWVVRSVQFVDEENRRIYFAASGMIPGQDPYFIHYYRIDFDGTGLVALTEADGNHTIRFSPDREYYVTTWSRVDLPPVTELRRTRDRSVVAELGRGDHSALLSAGWQEPEVFTAKGRDGETDIWGIIVRPSNFDPAKSYPVVESIYAGPHDNHVPKSFTVFPPRGMLEVAELGFVTVMIDGMGTANRSKAFHDVAWKNLGDAGFPDRILWHRAVAERYPYYDLDRVGIYGGSAGGQNALGGLLFHPDFYHVGVAHNGCHDNRMDKIWWNELWMGWPVGPQYAASSNVEHAHLLEGRLLLTVGELDTNVDPASTYQVADALIRADKEFDFVVIPGGGHARGPYHVRKRWDFLVRHLLDTTPPNWNQEGIMFAGTDGTDGEPEQGPGGR